ncbi:phthiocerol synthesis polyketide synthase type I PpsC [Kordia sp. SMS9]|uniref:type I polyketide synthase n=1 Tax=Kordia sp. SMS9 TaxID=2282170 RepID=UPI000E0CDEEB|nr:type I polyketide synthase [Kordia sp. SMS9]AXG72410.1 phthiocerol synthesis polyketide synthase type I PpsC [Kordia sp. SMS9]
MNTKNQPIAIVGIGCKFPGSSSSAEKFWEMMLNETDTIGDVPLDRWDSKKYYSKNDARSGKIRAQQGGFLTESAFEFDSLFFDMSPRESESLDPQQRMLMEVAYEALENAGMALEDVKGSSTGVFVGGFMLDNLLTQTSSKNRYHINSHTISGVAMTMLSNRLSYIFDLKGPSLTIDTACSSSLIATHYACQSIWNGESSMAMVGGVNYMLSPESSVLMSKGKFLSKHSRCKAFDSDAAGYVRGEGAGIIILKPLADAIKDNDRVYATIVGTGANQDGRTNGITVPNPDSQLQLIRKIYKDNNIDRNKVHYVEAHGTGTAVGDPIEFKTLNKALSEHGDRKTKCLVGSVKTNIGHLEAASGIAGLIKTALCLNNNKVPANLHFKNPNPALNYEESNLKIPTSVTSLPEGEDSYASINSFGFGGANAHLVLKQHNTNNTEEKTNALKKDQFLFPISAKSVPALKELAVKYKEYILENEDQFEQILSNAIFRRSNHQERLTIFATSQEDLIEKLEAYEEDILLKGVHQGSSLDKKPKMVFVYTGMGPQWWKMGRELMETEPVFMKAIKECDAEFFAISGWSIYEELLKPEESSIITETNVAQPANFVIQAALTQLLAHYGITPDAVVGHSVGEVASVYASGALSLKEALTVSYYRSSLQHSNTQGKGTMLAVGLSESEVQESIRSYENVSIAAINAPTSITISGNSDSLQELHEKYDAMGVFNRLLAVSVPYHSPLMSLVKDQLLDAVKTIKGTKTNIDLYSTVTGDVIEGDQIDNQYWYNNVREPVVFSKTINTILKDEFTVFVEVGPHPVLKNSILECIKNRKDCHLLQTLHKREGEQINFFENLSKLYTLGYPIAWNNWIEKLPFTTLPTYPWQKEYLWRASKTLSQEQSNGVSGLSFREKVSGPLAAYVFELNEYFFPFLNDHIVHGKVVFPGAGYMGVAIDMYQHEISQKVPFMLENIKFLQVLVIDEDEIQKLHISMHPENGNYSLQSQNGEENAHWTEMSSGKFAIGNFEGNTSAIDVNAIMNRLDTTINETEVYERLSQSKLDYGPHFRCIKEIQQGKDELVATIKMHEDMIETSTDYFIHPTLLDACFQTTIALVSMDVVPVSIKKVHCYAKPTHEIFCHSVLKFADDTCIVADLTICNEAGEVLMFLEGFKCKQLVKNELQSDEAFTKNLFETTWIQEEEAVTYSEVSQDTLTYIFTNDYVASLPLQEVLAGDIAIVEPGSAYKELGENHHVIDLQDKNSLNTIWNEAYKNVNMILMPSVGSNNSESLVQMSEKCLDQIMPLFNIVRFFSEKTAAKIKLSILTKASQMAIEGDVISSLEDSTLHGMGRLIVNELSNCQVRMIDVEENVSNEAAETMWDTVANIINTRNVPYEELAIRSGYIYHKKMVNLETDEKTKLKTVDFEEKPLKLKLPTTPRFESLHFENLQRQEPKANEIEILIENTVFSNLDCQKLDNKITDELIEGTFAGKSLGYECVGTIAKVGSDVTKFNVGDKVLALAPGTFQSYTVASAHLAVKCPSNLNIAASGVVMSYLTAIYCLRDKAGLGKGDTILIHNATDGVGLAAINYAKHVGAEIFATTESDENSSFLHSLGVTHVYNSENLDFATDIKAVTDGKGVDVVLSSQSGEIAFQNFASLAPYGIYVDISKKDIISNASIDMTFFNHNLSYIAVDMDRMLMEKKEKIAGLLEDLTQYIASGVLASLPAYIFSVDKLYEAFHQIKDNKPPGNVVIDFSNQPVEVANTKEGSIKADGTYLITGGTRGLGLEIGKWLVEKGAKNLALLSRSGLKSDTTIQEVEKMKKKGVNVQVYAADISKFHEVQQVFNSIQKDLPALTGIFHGAMVLDDGYLLDMNEDRFMNVLKPKVDGAMNLHYLSQELNLDNFVVFSSISSLIGNIGQANYVAANAFLDAFAHWRKSMNLAVTTVNLGVLKEAGVVSRNENIEKILEGTGIHGFSNAQVMQGIEFIIKEKPTQIGFFDLNWSVISKSFGKSGIALFSEIDKMHTDEEESLTETQAANREKLANLDPNAQHEFIVTLLKEQLGKILRIPMANIKSDKGINLLGVDSILTIEFMGMIKESLAVEIAPIEFLTGPSVRQLSTKIIENSFQTLSEELV